MQYNDCVKYMLKIPFYGKKNGLENIRLLLDKLGNPQDKLKIIHVAGTNGKGSVCTYLSSIYTRANYKVGAFTSPHLVDINERIKLNNINISDDDFVLYFNKVKSKIDEMIIQGLSHPTFFETIYAIAVLVFNDMKVDFAIIETGIGGRLDTTNIIKGSIASVITKISFDHTKLLGDTLEAIAKEKAGIIKPNGNVIILEQDDVIIDVIRDTCKIQNAHLCNTDKYTYKILKNDYKSIDFSLNTKYYGCIGLHIGVGALYQVNNCLLAIAVIESLQKQYKVSKNDIINGVSGFYWPGRMEVINDHCILDGSHNLDGINAFVDYINEYAKDLPVDILFTIMDDKKYKEIISTLCTLNNIKRVIITKTSLPKNADTLVLANEFRKNGFNNVDIEEDLREAFYNNYQKSRDGLFCCLGSLYLIGEVKNYIRRINT